MNHASPRRRFRATCLLLESKARRCTSSIWSPRRCGFSASSGGSTISQYPRIAERIIALWNFFANEYSVDPHEKPGTAHANRLNRKVEIDPLNSVFRILDEQREVVILAIGLLRRYWVSRNGQSTE